VTDRRNPIPVFVAVSALALLAFVCSGSAALAAGIVSTAQHEDSDAVAARQIKHHAEVQKHRAETERLQAETEKLHSEIKNSSGARGFFGQYAGVITALGALVAAGIAFLGQRKESNRLAKSDIATQQRAVDQRLAESDRDLAARFSQLLADLGSEREAVQAGAAVSLLTFLDQQDPTFHHQVRLATLANLKVAHPNTVTKLLRRTFERAMTSSVPFDPIEIDLSDGDLAGATLRNLNLEGARLDHVNLDHADLTNTSLKGAIGSAMNCSRVILQGDKASLFNARLTDVEAGGARLQGSELVNAHIRKADLGQAGFEGARLQAAHFVDCDLSGARFDGANVADTYFNGCALDDNALRSLLKARNLQKAHFDPGHSARLDELREDDRE
jgi:uncharacterized protein YjbI with pentapeptide repeats/cell division protein FtsB